MRIGKFTIGLGLYIIISASFMRQVWDSLGRTFGQNNVKIFCLFLFLAAAVLIIAYIVKSHRGPLKIIVNLAVIVFAFIFAWRQPFFTERIHILEYGLLGWLAMRDLSRDRPALQAALLTILFVLLVGGTDEFFQKLLPYRVGEIRDVLSNIISGALGIILFQTHKIRAMKAIKPLLIIILLLGLSGPVFAQGEVKLHFINVGEGEAILIQGGNENALIDTGGLLGGYKLLDYLDKNKVKKLKYLIITHPHPDHIGGAFFILPKIQVQEVYDNGQAINEDDDLQRWYKLMARSKENYHVLRKGDNLELGRIGLSVLWPPEAAGSSFNENSLVVMLDYNNFRCLFTADINKSIEARLLEDKADLKANILKVGHHGYKDATAGEFLQAVSPEAAVISAGPTARMTVPSPGTLDLLQSKGIKIYRTDKDGDIEIIVQQDGSYVINKP